MIPTPSIPVQLRWADFDANFHLRHSAYYDFGAMARITFLEKIGMTESFFRTHGFGPILFKEECTFRKEIKLHDAISITCQLKHCKPNGSRFTIVHQILKADNILAAELIVAGDWIDYATRKLLVPPDFLGPMMEQMPKHPQFTYL